MQTHSALKPDAQLTTAGLRRPLIIIIDRSGPFLAAQSQLAAHRLAVADLECLVALAAGEPWRSPSDVTLLDQLGARGLLGDARHAYLPSRDAAPPRDVLGTNYDGKFVLVAPVALRLSATGFEHLDHDGRTLLRIDARELAAATSFGQPEGREAAFGKHVAAVGERALDWDAFARLVGRLEAAGLLARAGADGEDTAQGKMLRALREGVAQSMRRAAHVDLWLAAQRAEENARAARTGRRRTAVIPVTNGDVPLLSLGLVMSYAQAYQDGRLNEHYAFVADWMNRTVPSLTGDEAPAVFLFSNYLWSHHWNLGASAAVKAKNRAHVTIHGGPDSPKYAGDVEEYFRANPHIDVAVHGEGDVTLAEVLAALQPSLATGAPDLTALAAVPGLSFRHGDTVVRSGDRERIANLDLIPSPFANGLFDSVGDVGLPYLIIETNRGCPYGCTYCDWGSATLSRIRKFDLARVFADLEWAARNKVGFLMNADANFGVFPRDVEIARKVVELKRQYGFPRLFGANYAKNTVQHLKQIVDTLVDGGILATGVLSMQSADPDTLRTIRRSNIKVDRYDDLAQEFSRNELPLVTELMMGLPGSTLPSFISDLQQCIDREMRARVYPTELLVNSPMNERAYREQNQIETRHTIKSTWEASAGGSRTAPLVIATATFTRDDYQQMDRSRRHFFLFENFGVLRQVARFVRQEVGLREMEFYRQTEDAVRADRERWPTIAFTFESLHDHLVAPASWRLLVDELRDYLTGPLGLARDTALETVLQVQHALLPSRDRSFPFSIELAHDYTAWHRRMLGLKLGGSAQDWAEKAPRLSSYGPASFTVTDPQSICRSSMGEPLLSSNEADWELRSPVGRTLTFLQSVGD